MRATLISSPAKKITAKLGEGISSVQPYFIAEYADHTASSFTEGGNDGAFNGVTDVDVIVAPAGSTQRVCRSMTVYNADTIPHRIIIQHDNAGTKRTICDQTIAAGANLYFTGGVPSVTLAASGCMEGDGLQRVYSSDCMKVPTSFLTISGVAYWVYMGQVKSAITPKYIEAYLNVVGATLSLNEAGIFSSPLPPCKAAQTLTKIAAVATWDSLLAGLGVKRSASMATAVPAGTHLWAGAKFAMTTNPTFGGLIYDNLQGHVLILGGAAAFSTAGPWNATLPAAVTAAAATTNCPNLQIVLD